MVMAVGIQCFPRRYSYYMLIKYFNIYTSHSGVMIAEIYLTVSDRFEVPFQGNSLKKVDREHRVNGLSITTLNGDFMASP